VNRALLLVLLTVGLVVGPASAGRADVDDFEFQSFDATYSLDTDADGRSTLTAVETLVAVFPEEDQNRGIRRELVDVFDGHPTDLRLASVEDGEGNPRRYETDTDDGMLVVTIAGDEYVHGLQTYVLTYTQHNVTRFFEDSGADEFYWDANGTGWAQPFERVSATVLLPPVLAEKVTGVDAVSGAEGGTAAVDSEQVDGGYTFTATGLGPRENLTFAIGFRPGTFVPRDGSFTASPFPLLTVLGTLPAVIAAAAALVVRRTRLRDARGRGIIVPQYLPPKDAGVLLSSVVYRRTAKATTAQILRLAVEGFLRIQEIMSGRRRRYRLQFVTDRGAGAEDLAFLGALFGARLTPGESRDLGRTDATAVKRITAVMKRVTSDASALGYRGTVPTGPVTLVVALAILGALATLVFGAISLSLAHGGALPGVLMLVPVLLLVVIGVLLWRVPLLARGVELHEYLEGLEQYIRLAEADRLRYLQSPEGAERMPSARIPGADLAHDPAQVVKLHERLLPYAALFGQEKRWAEEIGRYYEQTGENPTWYYGNSPFNAALFAGSIGAVGSSLASSYSSSSGGSAGGASSGGGGGGGGGGGV